MKSTDKRLADALHKYHRELLSNNDKIAARLLSDYGIIMRYVCMFSRFGLYAHLTWNTTEVEQRLNEGAKSWVSPEVV